jgi:hypothetical protein
MCTCRIGRKPRTTLPCGSPTTKRLRLHRRATYGATMTHGYSGMVCAPLGERAVSSGRHRGLYVFSQERESRNVRDSHLARNQVDPAQPFVNRGHGVELFVQAHQG